VNLRVDDATAADVGAQVHRPALSPGTGVAWHKRSALSLHWHLLRQTHQTQATKIVEWIADRGLQGKFSPEQLLGWATQRNLPPEVAIRLLDVPTWVARLDQPGANTQTLINSLRDVAQRYTAHSSSASVPFQSLPARSNAQVRQAFTYPSHWGLNSAGVFAPDKSKLSGKPAQMWAGVQTKFGLELASKLFDATVRSGLPGALDALNQAGSSKTLLPQDLLSLGYLSVAAKTSDPRERTVGKPSVHDLLHAVIGYGQSDFEENQANFFSDNSFDFMNRLLAPGQKLNAAKSLSSQSVATQTIDGEIRTGFAAMQRHALDSSTYDSSIRSGFAGYKLGSANSAMEDVRAIETNLDRGGVLTELNTNQRAELRGMLYGSGTKTSLESIVSGYRKTGDEAKFKAEKEQWVAAAGKLLQGARQPNQMKLGEFYERATSAVAFRIFLERVAPGWVDQRSPFSIGLDKTSDFPKTFANADLRSAYAKVLQDVRAALSPFAPAKP
jgi:hypothetical protein